MKKIALTALACLVILVPVEGVAGKAIVITAPPVPLQVAAATSAYAGKVTAVSEKTVAADMYKGDTRQMKIATVRVAETLVGKGAREVKVGFILGGTPGRRPLGYSSPQLAVGQEG